MASIADNAGLNLREICDILGTVKHKWLEIGIQLGVPRHVLKGFEKEGDPLASAIDYWLKGNVEDVPVCWESIITALKSPHVEEHGQAVKISAKYCSQNNSSSAKDDKGASTYSDSESVAASKISTNSSSGSSSQLSEVELRSHFPYLKDENLPETEKLKNIMQLREESKKLREKFTSLVHDFKQSLKESSQKIEDIIGIIRYYVDDEELTKTEELLSSCRTIDDVFEKLRGYTSFFNFDLIKVLISKLGSPSVKKKLKKYRQKFRDYCKHRICECPKDAFSDDKEETEHKYVLKTELKMTHTLEKLEQLRYSMNVILGRKTLRLLHVEEGCVKLTFRVLVGLSSSLTEKQQQSLRDNGVLHISYGDQQYDISQLDPTKKEKPDNLSSGDSAYVSASATQSITLYDTITEESEDINPAEELLKSAQHTSIDSRADHHCIIIKGNINTLKVAIKMNKYNPLSKDVYGYTALHTAAKYGKLKVMKYLIEEEGINPSIPGPHGTTPLNIAAEAGNLSIVQYLIEDQHVDLSTDKDQDGHLPLHRACLKNNLKMVKYLFHKMKEVCYMESNDILSEFTMQDTAPLHIAALHGHLDIVKFFIEECECDPNISNKAGRTALFLACENGSLEIVQYLVEVHHCQPSATDNSSNTPLHLAAQHGSLSIVQYLIEEKRCNIKCKNNQGNTPLLEASFTGMLNVVKYLTKIDSDPMIKSKYSGYNCLHAACHHGHTEVAQYLIKEQHIDPNTPTGNTKTNSLHIAATYGHEPTVQYLIEEGKINPKSVDENNQSPLALAFKNGHVDVFECLMDKLCLLAYKPNPLPLEVSNIATFLAGTEYEKLVPLNPVSLFYYNIVYRGRLDIIKKHKRKILDHISHNDLEIPLIHCAVFFGCLKIVKYFIAEDIYKGDCTSTSTQGMTPLHAAAQFNWIEIFQYLIKECKCDPMCRTSTDPTDYGVDCYSSLLGNTPLHCAIRFGHLEMIKHMLESDYGIDPEVETHNGQTPLLIAAQAGHIDTTEYLINKHKCFLSHRDKLSWSILHGAVKEGRLEMVKYLINNHHCDPLAEDNFGKTPFHFASICGRSLIIDYYLSHLKISPNIGDGKTKATALHYAAFHGHIPLVKYLTKFPKCNCSCIDTLKRTPLHMAAFSGKTKIVKYLTQTIKCNHMDGDILGLTPLHLAAQNGHFKVTKFLIQEMHTPPAIKTHFRRTPLDFALFSGHAKVALYLIVVLYNECCHMF